MSSRVRWRPRADGGGVLRPRVAGGEALHLRVDGGVARHCIFLWTVARNRGLTRTATRMVVRYRDLERGDDVLWPRVTSALADAGAVRRPTAAAPGSLRVEMRQILMVWQLEVAEEYKLSTETFWMSAALVDRSLEGRGRRGRRSRLPGGDTRGETRAARAGR